MHSIFNKKSIFQGRLSTQNEIMSTVYHQEKAQENPVLAAAKLRAKIGG
jgi:hypothetical protein